MFVPDASMDLVAWERDGFVRGLRWMDAEEATARLQAFEALEAAALAEQPPGTKMPDFRPWDHADHPLRAWMTELVDDPRLHAMLVPLLGPDLLLRNADVFAKAPGLRRGIGWHWDTAELGPDADHLVTVWLALTTATPANGGLRYAAGSHRLIPPDAPTDRHRLTFSPTAVAALDPASFVDNALQPGQVSVHHFRLAHSSGPNTTTGRRIGIALRVLSPRCSPETAESGQAYRMTGTGPVGRWQLRDRFPMTWTA